MESTLNPTPVVRKLDTSKSPLSNNLVLAVISIVVVLAGIGTGYLLSGASKNSSSVGTPSGGSFVATKNEAGVADESKFAATTEGVLEEGGIGGEGTHHLVKGSGPSQYAYLTSSVVDLSIFEGKKVQIWGDTMSGKKAGWLIDVGKIKVIE